ncbi:efflux RND transporter periplasmic adaptor subunit [Hyalangium gracile]|uniref:efflux RND transporter periplasmic adaptor subunit n=1 Tax=Hyalangium gracile TaxID=394092 RepID=UPI001CCD558A|nr:HlyD family efflux transporter periplasmic adaptor subunit [Hyalangium gracile]
MTQETSQKLFRQQALEHHARPEAQGALLQLAPIWARTAYWIVVALVTVGGVGLALVDIHDYAQGPAFVQVKGVEDVISNAGGKVSRVRVKRGQQVKAGEPLVELYASLESVERERLEQEFRTQLAATLLNPNNTAAQQALSNMRSALDLSQARLAERSLRSPFDGWIHDVRVREGQVIGTGEVVVSVMREGTECWVQALVPGRYRPMIKPGQGFRLELEGFPYLYQELTVDSLSDELVGPAEVRRYLGPDLGDAVQLEGPVMVVEARLPASSFRTDKRDYNYYTGMPGTARIKVRARNGWVTLLPILEYLRNDDE